MEYIIFGYVEKGYIHQLTPRQSGIILSQQRVYIRNDELE